MHRTAYFFSVLCILAVTTLITACLPREHHVHEYRAVVQELGTADVSPKDIWLNEASSRIEAWRFSREFMKTAHIPVTLDIDRDGHVHNITLSGVDDAQYRQVLTDAISRFEFRFPTRPAPSAPVAVVDGKHSVQAPRMAAPPLEVMRQEVKGYRLVISFKYYDYVYRDNAWK